MKRKAQTEILLNDLQEIKNKIYKVCRKCKCVNLTKCIERSTLCTSDSAIKTLCERNGADFSSYISIRNNIIELNMGFVVQRASSLGYDSTCVADMIQQGVLGMLRAIDMFDVNRGATFLTYAFHHIKKSMLMYARDNNIVRRKGHIQDLVNKANTIVDRMLQDMNSTKLTINMVKKELVKNGYSIPKSSSGARWLDDVIEDIMYELEVPGDDNIINSVEEQDDINNFYEIMIDNLDNRLGGLPIKIQQMIKMRFGIGSYTKPMNLIEVASILNVTKQYVDKKVTTFFIKNSKLLQNDILY